MIPALMEALLREEHRAREHECDLRFSEPQADRRAEEVPRPDPADDDGQA